MAYTDVVRKVNKHNVSTAKGIAGGYLFSAPIGTTVPTGWWEELDPAFECLGYVGEDGFEESADGSSDDIKDLNGDVVGDYDEGTTETCAFTLIEISNASMAARFGHENVSEATDTMIVDHNWTKAKEQRVLVADLVLKNGRRWRKVIPESTVSERGGIQLNGSNVVGSEITAKYLNDESGSGCKDYIQRIDENGKPIPHAEGSGNGGGAESAQKSLDEMTVDELKAYAAAHDIDITGKTVKADILQAIKDAESADAAGTE